MQRPPPEPAGLPDAPAGSEALKNMVLGGISSFTVVDGARVEPADLGSNFFVTAESLAGSRAQVHALGALWTLFSTSMWAGRGSGCGCGGAAGRRGGAVQGRCRGLRRRRPCMQDLSIFVTLALPTPLRCAPLCQSPLPGGDRDAQGAERERGGELCGGGPAQPHRLQPRLLRTV